MVKPPVAPARTAVEPNAAREPLAEIVESTDVDAARTCPRCGLETSLGACPNDGAPTFTPGEDRSAELPKIGALVTGRYRLDRVLGSGAMGAVFAATDVSLDRVVAIKMVRPERVTDLMVLRRFYREADALSRLSHAGIVPLLDFGIDPATQAPFTVLRFVDGPSLAQYVLQSGPSSEAQARIWLGQLAGALAHAHANGIVHRDVKPANVLIEDGELRLTDFGLVKLDDAAPLTRAGAALGTPMYMAPEQAMGGRVDARTDLYALGCMIDVIVLGHAPFTSRDKLELLTAHVAKAPPQLPALLPDGRAPSPDLIALRSALLAKSPGDRPASAHEVRERLRARDARVAPEPTTAPMAALPDSSTASESAVIAPQPPRSRRAWAAIVLVSIALAGIVAWATRARVDAGRGPSIAATSSIAPITPPVQVRAIAAPASDAAPPGEEAPSPGEQAPPPLAGSAAPRAPARKPARDTEAAPTVPPTPAKKKLMPLW